MSLPVRQGKGGQPEFAADRLAKLRMPAGCGEPGTEAIVKSDRMTRIGARSDCGERLLARPAGFPRLTAGRRHRRC